MQFGLLGKSLKHSYSPQIHEMLGDPSYRLFEKDELKDFLQSGSFDGLNVTIPYKKDVLKYCDELSDAVRAIGSANTIVKKKDGTLFADNTDHYGFSVLLDENHITVQDKKVLVFGSGGASLAVQYALSLRSPSEIVVISRSGENNYQTLQKHSDAQILINTTPLGMYPQNGESPCNLESFPRCEGVVDLIYNPRKTALLLQAEKLRIPHADGLLMLVAQAKKSRELFIRQRIDDAEIMRIYQKLSAQMQNIILIGMPGCGKSTVGALVAEKLKRPFYDADEEICKQIGMTIPEYFERFGEDAFRKTECEILKKLGAKSGCVIATGGGCVTRKENCESLHQNGKIYWITRKLSDLATNGRPISQKTDLHELYQQRKALYAQFADETVENEDPISVAKKIAEEYL